MLAGKLSRRQTAYRCRNWRSFERADSNRLRLEDLFSPGDSVLIVVSDATRATASAQILNLLVRRLIQNGVSPADLAIIFATGIHRPVTPEKKLNC